VKALRDGELRLRPWLPDDLHELVEAANDPEIGRWMPAIPYPYLRGDGEAYIRRSAGRDGAFAIMAEQRLVGGIAVSARKWKRAEVGYWVRADARGRGIGSRALALAAEWGFAHGYRRLQLHADVENLASQRVAEKAGFRREGVLRAWIEQNGVPRDHVMYSRLESDR
jgi:RimJ/RimL family protein N-acetyltransferase